MKRKLDCILLVDDDDATNYYNKLIIKKAGITERIEVSLNGRDAIDYLTNAGKYKNNGTVYPQPSLILLDINMPVMDGWNFLEEYEKLDDNRKGKIVVVMLTTSFNPDDRLRAEEFSDVSDYINKPLSVGMLKEIVGKHF